MIELDDARVWVAGHYTDDGPIVEVHTTDVVPKGQVILSDEPVWDEEYERKASVGLDPDTARELARQLEAMADRIEKKSE